jgi:AraC-like DNA-binding protein
MRLKIVGILLCLFINDFSHAQAERSYSYDELISHIEMHQGTPKVWVYLNQYLRKAKSEGNWGEIVSAYDEMMHECKPELRLVYADSMIGIARQSGNNDLIGSSYLSKGIVYYQKKQHRLALDNYILANRYLLGTRDQYLIHKVKYSVAQIKYYLGYYHEAIALFTECIKYYKKEEALPYLYSIHATALCYIYTGDLDKAKEFNDISSYECKRLGVKSMLPYIDMAKGIGYFKQGKYNSAVQYLTYALSPIAGQDDFANEAVVNFYLGKSLHAKGDSKAAIPFFLKVDGAFARHNYIRPDLREAYEFLIPYFQKIDKPSEELKYIKRLLTADSILNMRFTYLVKKVHKEYDTRELLSEKERIESDLEKSQLHGYLFKSLAVILAATLVYLVRRYLKLKRLHRQRFESLLNESPVQSDKRTDSFPEVLDINPAIVDGIVTKLINFEGKNGFLKKDLTANKLAEQFDTNYKYLSRVIRHERQKSFVNYINDMRVDYLVERLKNEPLLRRYNNGGLASECGFSTAQHFVTAFKKRAKISPGYFCEELNKLPYPPG